MMGMSRNKIVVAAAAVLLVAGSGVAVGEPLHEPIKVEVPAPIDGIWDPLDPPLIAGLDPAVALLAPPVQHPWMLVGADDLDAVRARVLGAAPDSVVGKAWAGLKGRVDACCEGRSSALDALTSFPERNVGRDDLLEVGFVWRITQDPMYLAKARALLRYLVATAPDHGATLEPGIDEWYIQRAHRLNGLALAYDLLEGGFTQGESAQLLALIVALGEQQFAHSLTAWWGTVSSGSNIGAVNAAALATAGLATWHVNPTARAWVARGEQLTRAYFHEGFDPDGAGYEGVLYGNYGMRVPTFLNHALRRAGHSGIDAIGGVDHHQEWVAYEVLPGGGAVNPINDARYHEFNPYFTAWSSSFGDTASLSRWIFDEVTRKGPRAHVDSAIPVILWYEKSDPDFDPASILPLAKGWSERGLVHVRSGWEADDLMASFEARQNDWGEGVHHNQDVNSFTLYADGARFVVDSRYGNWLSKLTALDFDAMPTSETEAHNYLVADGRGQDFLGKGELRSFATTVDHVGDTRGLDLAVGSARQAYMIGQPRRADRAFLHVRAGAGADDYVVVADRFRQDDADHDHTWFLHTDWANEMTAPGTAGETMRVVAPNGAAMSMTMVAAQPFTSAVGSFTPDDEQDWRHLDPPGRRSHDRLEVTSRGDAFESIAVLVPTAPGKQAPTVRAIPAEGGVALIVDHGRSEDVILLATGDSTSVSAAGVSVQGWFGMERHRGTRTLARAAVAADDEAVVWAAR